MTWIIFIGAFVGGVAGARRNGMKGVQAFGAAVLMALVLTALFKFVFGL